MQGDVTVLKWAEFLNTLSLLGGKALHPNQHGPVDQSRPLKPKPHRGDLHQTCLS